LAGLKQKYPDRPDISTLQDIIALAIGQPEDTETQLKRAIEESDESQKLMAEIQLAR